MFGFSRLILKTLHKITPERDFYWSAHSETIYHWTRARAARPAVYGFTMRRSKTQKLFPILCSANKSIYPKSTVARCHIFSGLRAKVENFIFCAQTGKYVWPGYLRPKTGDAQFRSINRNPYLFGSNPVNSQFRSMRAL